MTKARPPGTEIISTIVNAPESSAQREAIRAVFFDVGDTLLRPRRTFGSLLAEVSRELGISLPPALQNGLAARIEDRIAERTRQRQPFTFPIEVSQQFWYDTYHDYLRDYLSRSHAHQLAESLLAELSGPGGYVLFDDTIDTLVELHRDGYHLGIISNWEAWLPALLKVSGLARYVDTVVISGICRVEKPDPRIFALALAEAGLAPGEVVYVGDRPAHDVIPARQAGITPILLDREGRFSDHTGWPRISSLDQVLAMLRWMSGEHLIPEVP